MTSDARLAPLRDAIAVVNHDVERMPDSQAKARLSSQVEALRKELDRWEDAPLVDEAHDELRRRIISLQLVAAKVRS